MGEEMTYWAGFLAGFVGTTVFLIVAAVLVMWLQDRRLDRRQAAMLREVLNAARTYNPDGEGDDHHGC